MENNQCSKIKEFREKAGFSRAALSRVLEIPIRTLECWEYGTRVPPSWAEKLIIEKIENMERSKNMSKRTYTIKTESKETILEMTDSQICSATDLLVKLEIPCVIYNEDGSVYYESDN